MSANETINLPQSVSFTEVVCFWLKLGFISFRGLVLTLSKHI